MEKPGGSGGDRGQGPSPRCLAGSSPCPLTARDTWVSDSLGPSPTPPSATPAPAAQRPSSAAGRVGPRHGPPRTQPRPPGRTAREPSPPECLQKRPAQASTPNPARTTRLPDPAVSPAAAVSPTSPPPHQHPDRLRSSVARQLPSVPRLQQKRGAESRGPRPTPRRRAQGKGLLHTSHQGCSHAPAPTALPCHPRGPRTLLLEAGRGPPCPQRGCSGHLGALPKSPGTLREPAGHVESEELLAPGQQQVFGK